MAVNHIRNAITSILGVTPEKAAEMFNRLTPREREVVELFAKGLSRARIAEQLGITLATLGSHRQNIKIKLLTNSPLELSRLVYAVKLADALQ